MILTKTNYTEINIDELINSTVKKGKFSELLFIVPTNRKARKVRKGFVDLAPNQATTKLQVETLGSLVTNLLGKIKPFHQLSEAASSLFIKQCAKKIDLKFFSLYKKQIPKGTLERIKNVISKYKQHGITPTNLRNEATVLEGTEKLKALDIANIYEEYLKKCNDKRAFEIGDCYQQLLNQGNEKISEVFRKTYPYLKTLVINGFDEFTFPEIDLIDVIASSSFIELFINFDYYRFNKNVFSHLDECYASFMERGFLIIKDISENAENKFQSNLKENFFNNKKEYNSKINKKITKLTAQNKEQEVEILAKEIKELIIKEKIEPHKICIAFNSVNNYSHLIRNTFVNYNIPFNLTDRLMLENSLPVTALFNFLEIVQNDFYYKNIFRALSSSFVMLEGIDLGNLIEVSNELKIVAGEINWKNKIKQEIKKLEYENDNEKEVLKDRYRKALSNINMISSLLKGFKRPLTLKEFQTELYKLAEKIKLPYMVLRSKLNNTEEFIKGLSYFFETLKEVFELLYIDENENTSHKLTYFIDQIRTILSWGRFNIKEKNDCGVQITSGNEIRGINFDYLFIAGMCDGDFPTRYQPEIFFSGSFRTKEEVHLTKERFHFYQMLSLWKKHLFLSFPKFDSEKETAESIFIKEIERLYKINQKCWADYSNKIYRKSELQKEIGKIKIETAKAFYAKEENLFQHGYKYFKHKAEIEKARNLGIVDEYSGIIDTTQSPIIKSYSEREYSISQLETYATCPFNFFAERILNLKNIGAPTEQIEAMELGAILHNIFFLFYSKIREEKIVLKNCTDKIFEKSLQLLFKVAEEQFEKIFENDISSFYEREKIFGIAGNKKESILYNFLNFERIKDDTFTPKFFEVSFGTINKEGTDKELSSDKPISAGKVKLKGKIDRIDIDEANQLFNIVDYKLSGKTPTGTELKEGLKLQLPIYMFVAENILAEKSNLKPMFMQIYSLKMSEDDFGAKNISLSRKKGNELEENQELISFSIEKINDYVKNISEGKFNLSKLPDREKKVCNYCNYKYICRIKKNYGK